VVYDNPGRFVKKGEELFFALNEKSRLPEIISLSVPFAVPCWIFLWPLKTEFITQPCAQEIERTFCRNNQDPSIFELNKGG
jgi:hypothetical protein